MEIVPWNRSTAPNQYSDLDVLPIFEIKQTRI